EEGARGVGAGVVEKRASLEYAQAVRRYLEAAGVRVVMTREADTLVPIRERVRRANAARADAFVSIHLNASNDHSQRGFEAYLLAPEAQDREARELALREAAHEGPVAAIVQDLVQEAVAARAVRVGRAVQRQLMQVVGARFDRGLKQAPLDVLKG